MESPRFGTYIRAARLMFHWSSRLGGFMRMTPLNFGVRVELEPYDVDMSLNAGVNYKTRVSHLLWWLDKNDNINEDEVIDLSPVLRRISKVKRRIVFDLDDSGEIIK